MEDFTKSVKDTIEGRGGRRRPPVGGLKIKLIMHIRSLAIEFRSYICIVSYYDLYLLSAKKLHTGRRRMCFNCENVLYFAVYSISEEGEKGGM